MKHLKTYKLYESTEGDVEYFQSMIADLVDEGYDIEVKSYVNPGAWKEEGISISIQREYSNPIVISDIVEKIKQIQSISPEYVVWNIAIDYFNLVTLDYKSLDDIKVKDMLRRGGLYSVLEYGMDEWISEMVLDKITKPFEFFSGPGYKYHFIKPDESPGGSDHELKIEIAERDIEEDVRPCISYMKIWLDRENKKHI